MFVKRFRAAERPGVYCVLRPAVQASAAVTLERYAGATISIVEMFRDFYDRARAPRRSVRHLAAPIAAQRADVEEKAQG